MRSGFTQCLATALLITGAYLVTGSAVAGQLSIVDGRTIWQSTQCQEPATPAVLSGVKSGTDADSVNARVSQYNQYVQQAQVYMDCISQEAQRDAAATSQAIVSAGQTTITNTQNNVTRLGVPLQTKQ